MVGVLPFRIDDRSFSDLHYAVTRQESDFAGRVYEVNMRPLVPMVMHVVCDLAEQNAFISRHTVSFAQERGKSVCECVFVLLRGTDNQSETLVEILLDVFA